MTDTNEVELEKRWERIRSVALANQSLLDRNPSMGELADWTGLPWYRTIRSHPLSYYLSCNYYELTNIWGFGLKKRARLANLVEASMEISSDALSEASPVLLPEPSVQLKDWGVDQGYPVRVMPLPARVLKFCENENVMTLGDLLATTAEFGEQRLLACRNLGRKSVDHMLNLVQAIRKGDRDLVRNWLPLAEGDLPGLSLRMAVRQLLADLDSRQRPLLERRYGRGMTLEKSAQALGVTRERARQIARDFLLEPLAWLLDAYPEKHADLFQGWLANNPPSGALGPLDSYADSKLLDGALGDLFSDTPEAIATRLERETQFEVCFERLKDLREFHQSGADLQAFIDANLPARLHEKFTTFLFQKPGLILNHDLGLIAPERPLLRRLVHRIIADEDDPIPATWLIRQIHVSPRFASLDTDDLRRRFRGWIQHYPDFPRDRILWAE